MGFSSLPPEAAAHSFMILRQERTGEGGWPQEHGAWSMEHGVGFPTLHRSVSKLDMSGRRNASFIRFGRGRVGEGVVFGQDIVPAPPPPLANCWHSELCT